MLIIVYITSTTSTQKSDFIEWLNLNKVSAGARTDIRGQYLNDGFTWISSNILILFLQSVDFKDSMLSSNCQLLETSFNTYEPINPFHLRTFTEMGEMGGDGGRGDFGFYSTFST